jgi:DHA3 family macrolide efflux protein-like MFS transporter
MRISDHWRRPFLTLYVGQAFSLLSSSAAQFAIIWWITAKTGSAISLAIASLAGLLPQALIGPFAGVAIDRHERKTVMIIADIGVALSSLALGASFIIGDPPLGFVFAILFLRALGETFHKPALQAAIPQLVPGEELTRAGGLGQLISALCSMIGPILGAALTNAMPLRYIMLIDIGGAVLAVSALTAVRLPSHVGQTAARKGVFAETKEGLAAIGRTKGMLRATIPIFLTSMVFMPLGSFLPLMVKDYFLGGALQGGIIQTLFSVGMLASAAAFGIAKQPKRPFALIALSSFLLGLCSIVGGLLPPGAFWAFCVVVLIIGGTGMMGNIPYMAYIQKRIAPENLGKAISAITSFISLGIPLGIFAAGPIAEKIGVGKWMLGVGIVLAAIGMLSYFATKRLDYGPEARKNNERG